jgi:hypothetical protein
MFEKSIIFVVGAGASVDYGMPLGSDLVERIAKDTNFYFDHLSTLPTRGDKFLFEVLRHRFRHDPTNHKINRYLSAGQLLASVLTSAISIDDALYQLNETPEAVELGKACILRTILEKESKSTLRSESGTDRPAKDAGKDGWIEQVFSMAITDLRQSEIKGSAFHNVTFINFNYDRCIEHYIYHALLRIGLPPPDAKSTVEALTIIRPYGSLGPIFQGSNSLPFGNFNQRQDFFPMIDRIRTYTESEAIHDREQTERLITDAAMVVFLGFGFHRQNLELLKPKETGFRNAHIIGTVVGIYHGNLPALSDSLRGLFRSDKGPELIDMTSAALLRALRIKIMMLVGG